jgi:hypothetical protein
VKLSRGFAKHAEGAVLIEFGDTQVLRTAEGHAFRPHQRDALLWPPAAWRRSSRRRANGDRMHLVLASSNPAKLRELSQLLSPLGHTFTPQGAPGIRPVEETGTTFLENTLLKARHAGHFAHDPALADESGIEVNRGRRDDAR